MSPEGTDKTQGDSARSADHIHWLNVSFFLRTTYYVLCSTM